MKTPTYEDYLANPSAVMEQVHLQARRERAEAMHQCIAALLQLFKRAPKLQPVNA
jgi:hypothetical protein